MMTTFRIPLSSSNDFYELALDVLGNLKEKDNITNILATIGQGKSTLLANIILICLEYSLFERILYISNNITMLCQFEHILLRLLNQHEIEIRLSKDIRLIETLNTKVMLTTFRHRFEGYTNDLILIDESHSLTEHNYCDLFPVYLRSKGLITTSDIPPKFFRSKT